MEVYFDNSATTKPYDEVVEVMCDTLKNCYGNPSSAYILGIQAERKINAARELVANAINASKEEIIFTSCGSESNNFLIKGFLKPDSHIITTKIEHPSVYRTMNSLEKEGIEVTYLDVDSFGRIDIDELAGSIKSTTQIVSIIFVNNEIGTLQDISRIGKIIKEKSSRVKFHVDAVQGFGKHKIDVKEMNIDLLSISGHKVHGPKGVGAAYLRKGLAPNPLIYGGGQERGLRSGTENVASIVGLGKAVEIIFSRIDVNYNNILELKDYFGKGLAKLSQVNINSGFDNMFSPYILSASFKGVRGEVMLHLLEEKGIFVSTGSACSSHDTKESHVLKAIGLNKEDIAGTLRFSFNEYNTKDEVDYTLGVIDESLRFLRRLKI